MCLICTKESYNFDQVFHGHRRVWGKKQGQIPVDLGAIPISAASANATPPQGVPVQGNAAAPYQAGPLPGAPNQGMPTQHTLQNVGGITAVNSTGDPRVLWEDGKFAVIHARDFPANTGMGRSATRPTMQAAMTAAIDPGRQNAAGPGSMQDFCKVVLAELLARPLTGVKKQTTGFAFKGRPDPKPMIASGYGTAPKGTVIPDAHFPHNCGVCGGWYYMGTGEHPTPDGKCPKKGGGDGKPMGRRR